ncbi:MAG: flavodoxin family protein [Clostridiales bacterium]
MAKRILVITGSPKPKGNTNTLADAFIEGAKAQGNTVTKIHVGSSNVHGCKDCKYCFKHNGECVQKDDMQDIMPHFYNADMVVFSTPVYFFGLTSQVKAVIDRLYASMTKPLPIQEAIFMSVMGDTNMETMVPSVANFKAICGYLKWNISGIITAGGINDPGDIDNKPILEEAEELGRSIS